MMRVHRIKLNETEAVVGLVLALYSNPTPEEIEDSSDIEEEAREIFAIIERFFSKKRFTPSNLKAFFQMSPVRYNNDLDDSDEPVQCVHVSPEHLEILEQQGLIEYIGHGRYVIVDTEKYIYIGEEDL